ncbi:DUF4270 family protein [Flavobacterium sp. TBRC 19031]|uniref:DUF4270 family protein n=1 Tax=Flavobacterium mekongense TaxID=3379707 RepID=UPI00399A1476
MKQFFYLMVIGISLSSCVKEETDFFSPSGNFVNSNLEISVIDTISFKMSTIKLDSIITDVNGKILVGRYNDPVFGVIVASGYVDYAPDEYEIDDEAVFDSVVLNLPYSKYFYNDTLQQKTIKVEELAKTIRFRNGQYNFYNTTNIQTTNLIGQRSFYPRVNLKDSIKTTLNYNFGLNLFNKIRDGDISDLEDLKLIFKGIKISSSDAENASIVGFNVVNSYIRFYYSIPDEPGEAKYYDFGYNNYGGVNKYFTQIYSDRTNTVFPNFINNETEFFPTSAVPFTYVNSGVGIVTKFAFPYFQESIANLNQAGIIYKANLKIPIKANSYSRNLYTADSVQVFVVDQNNDIVRTLDDGYSQAVGYVKQYEPGINEKYLEVPISSFLKTALNTPLYKNYGLIIVPFDYNTSTSRMILNSNKNTDDKTKLILTYLNYEN